jgi:hypothetical protein
MAACAPFGASEVMDKAGVSACQFRRRSPFTDRVASRRLLVDEKQHVTLDGPSGFAHIFAIPHERATILPLQPHELTLSPCPRRWTEAMRPLQDQCYPTPLPRLDEMLRKDMAMSMDDLFSDFDPEPIGVASVRSLSVGCVVSWLMLLG